MWARLLGVCGLTLLLAACQPAGSARSSPVAGDPARGRQLFVERGCTGCHTMAGYPGAAGTLGPPLTSIASTAGVRRGGESPEDYIRESIARPNAYVVPGFSAPSPMPPALALGPDLDDLVAFLMTQR